MGQKNIFQLFNKMWEKKHVVELKVKVVIVQKKKSLARLFYRKFSIDKG
jgi:hypothetical protein